MLFIFALLFLCVSVFIALILEFMYYSTGLSIYRRLNTLLTTVQLHLSFCRMMSELHQHFK